MLWPMIPVALRWLHLEERKAVRVDREIDNAAAPELMATALSTHHRPDQSSRRAYAAD